MRRLRAVSLPRRHEAMARGDADRLGSAERERAREGGLYRGSCSVDAGGIRLPLRPCGALGAPPDLSRDGSGGRREVRRGAQGGADADRVRRRNAGRARGGAHRGSGRPPARRGEFPKRSAGVRAGVGDRHRAQRVARAGAGGARVPAQESFERYGDPLRRQREAAECAGAFCDAGRRWRVDRRRVAGGGRFSLDPARGAGPVGRKRQGQGLMLITLLIVLHVLVALTIIGLVLIQHGKGADMGSGFGGGASGSLFGATGSANFLSRTTAVLAAIFFVLSLALAYTASRKPAAEGGGVIDAIRNQEAQKPPTKAEEKPAAAPEQKAAEPAQDKQVPQ